MIINSGVTIDSYSSSAGPYGASNIGNNGNVQAATQITVNSGGVVHGTLYPNDPAGFTPVPTPTTYTNLGNLNIGSNMTFQAGNYLVNTLNVNGTPTISVQGGPVRIWFNSLNLAGIVGAGATTPSELIFFSLTTATQVNISGNGTTFTGVIFAPNIPVNIGGTGNYYGACMASRVIFNSVLAVHYDQDLGEGCMPGVPASDLLMAAVKETAPMSWLPVVQNRPLVAVPNPARNKVTLFYQLDVPARYTVMLVDITGKTVDTMEMGWQPSGIGSVQWDLGRYAAGVYWLVGRSDNGQGAHHTALFKLALLGQ